MKPLCAEYEIFHDKLCFLDHNRNWCEAELPQDEIEYIQETLKKELSRCKKYDRCPGCYQVRDRELQEPCKECNIINNDNDKSHECWVRFLNVEAENNIKICEQFMELTVNLK